MVQLLPMGWLQELQFQEGPTWQNTSPKRRLGSLAVLSFLSLLPLLLLESFKNPLILLVTLVLARLYQVPVVWYFRVYQYRNH